MAQFYQENMLMAGIPTLGSVTWHRAHGYLVGPQKVLLASKLSGIPTMSKNVSQISLSLNSEDVLMF